MISGPEVETVSKNSVEAGPGECPFELRHSFTTERAAGDWYKQIGYLRLNMSFKFRISNHFVLLQF